MRDEIFALEVFLRSLLKGSTFAGLGEVQRVIFSKTVKAGYAFTVEGEYGTDTIILPLALKVECYKRQQGWWSCTIEKGEKEHMTTQKQWSFTYEVIDLDDLASTDLKEEAKQCSDGVQALRIRVLDADEQEQAERAEGLYDPESGRLGIAWGADASWASVEGVESGIDRYLNDGELWSQRN